MNTKITYNEAVKEYVRIEKELIRFLKEASGEDLYAVFAMIDAVYDPCDDTSVLTAAYALEFDVTKFESDRVLCTNTVYDREVKENYLTKNYNSICDVTTINEYEEQVQNGRIPNPRFAALIEEYRQEIDNYLSRFDVEYTPSSNRLDMILEELKETSYDLYMAREGSINRPAFKPVKMLFVLLIVILVFPFIFLLINAVRGGY